MANHSEKVTNWGHKEPECIEKQSFEELEKSGEASQKFGRCLNYGVWKLTNLLNHWNQAVQELIQTVKDFTHHKPDSNLGYLKYIPFPRRNQVKLSYQFFCCNTYITQNS